MKNGVYKLKKDAKLSNGVEFKKGQEFEVVDTVVYMGGHPLDFRAQNMVLSWMKSNKELFINDTRNF
jgi:hypothetical protein